ncbi:aa3-type cytochrome c oxidase subunit IV [Aquicoccus sp. SCR17]|nr:aa3-type cytochrome c oxidase subunit IV [Carideicomes alvinocaridis]
MADHKHGEMDITTQEKTFDGFITFVSRTVVVIIVCVILLAFLNV